MAADTLTALLGSVPAPAGLASLASVLPSTEGSSDAATFTLKAITRLAAAGPGAGIEQVILVDAGSRERLCLVQSLGSGLRPCGAAEQNGIIQDRAGFSFYAGCR